MSRVARALVMGVALVLVGCSGESSAPTTTTSSTTTPSTTDSTTTTSSTTTTTTSTTLDPRTEIEADVEAAYLRAYEVFVDCYRTLPDCDPNEVFPEAYTEPTLAAQVVGALQVKADNLIYGPPDSAEHSRTEVLEVAVSAEMTSATVSYCTLAADQEYAVAADGGRTLTEDNETVLVDWGEANMVLDDDGVWRLSNYSDGVGDVVELKSEDFRQQLEEGTLCGGGLNG